MSMPFPRYLQQVFKQLWDQYNSSAIHQLITLSMGATWRLSTSMIDKSGLLSTLEINAILGYKTYNEDNLGDWQMGWILHMPIPRLFLQTWINFNPSMDKSLHPLSSVGMSEWLVSMAFLSKVGDKIPHRFPNFNGAAAEVWEWISNFIPDIKIDAITYPCRELS